jgi:hypothetical protein
VESRAEFQKKGIGMNCVVCGHEIGFWSKLTHSKQEVCSACHEQGSNQLQVLVQAVGAAPKFDVQYAERWAGQLEEAVKKYLLPQTEVTRFRISLLENMFKLVEREELMPEAGLQFLADLSRKYDIQHSSTPELKDTFLRVGMREFIQEWEKGTPPKQQCHGLVLQKGEICHWEEAAGLRIRKTQREYVGRSSSVSIPLGHGIRYRVGGFKGHPIDHTVHEDAGNGILHLTNQRVCFTGVHTIAIAFKKMVSVNGFEGGFIIQTSNERKPGIFLVRHPELTTQMLLLASNPAEEELKPRKQRKSVPTLPS